MTTFINGVNVHKHDIGKHPDMFGLQLIHRSRVFPECELNFSFVNTKAYTFHASQPAFFGGVL